MIPQLIVPTHCMVWVYAEKAEMVPWHQASGEVRRGLLLGQELFVDHFSTVLESVGGGSLG